MKIYLAFIITISLSANAGIYKWTDKDGNVHYGDSPQEQVKLEELNIDVESRDGITNSSSDKKERDRMSKELEADRKERADKREQKKIDKQNKRKRCTRAKDDLQSYQNASAIYRLDSKGERVYYSKKERKEKIQRLNKSMSKACR